MIETTKALKTAGDLQVDAAYLAAVLEGVDVLYENIDAPGELGRMSANALVAILADARRRANELANDLDSLRAVDRREVAA